MTDDTVYRYPVCVDAQDQRVRVGDIVQLDPQRHVKFGGCYLTVTLAAHWGVVGYVAWPEAPTAARCSYRAEAATYRRVGVSVWWAAPDLQDGA